MQNILSPQYIGDQYIFTPLVALVLYDKDIFSVLSGQPGGGLTIQLED
jgi:hypothetical protein